MCLSIGKRTYELQFLSSKKMIIFIKKFLEDNLNMKIVNKISKCDYKNTSLYRIRFFNPVMIVKILNYLYDGATIYLDRKYELYKEIKDFT